LMTNQEPKASDSHPLPSGRDYKDDFIAWKEFVKDLKREWKHLWRTRIDDKVRAEGIASDEFPRLFVEKGTVIIATRNYKPPSFHEILMQYMPQAIAEQAYTTPYTGGIGKFIRDHIRPKQKKSRREPPQKPKKPANQQLKHGGRGWLHYTLE